MNLNELLTESLKGDEVKLAYTIFWAMQKKLVVGTDRFETLQGVTLDQAEISELVKQNPLSMKPVLLYSMHIEDNLYLFVLSVDEMGARQVYYDLYNRFPKSVGDATSRMDLTMWSKEEGYRTFRQIKDGSLQFPTVALIYEKE